MEKNVKAAMVAAVSEALKYKAKNPAVQDGEIISHTVKIADEIINRMNS